MYHHWALSETDLISLALAVEDGEVVCVIFMKF